MILQRSFCVVLAVALSATTSRADDDSSQADGRRAVAHHLRRIIFNNDGNDPILKIRRPDVGDMLAARTTPLAGTQVDALAYCTFCAGFSNFTHLTKIGQVHLTTEDVFLNNQMPALVKLGIDPLTEMTRFAHANKMECFWSMRMNDTHDGGKTGQGPVLFANNKLKQEHPEYLLGKPFEKLEAGSWSGVDYGHPEIRDLAFAYVNEVCQNYDVDGIELDFTRHAVFFNPTTRNQPCGDEQIRQMTDLISRVRAAADAAGQKRGRPILLIARLPDSPAYCKAIGLDIESWLKNGLIDLLVPGGYFRLIDDKEVVEFGHRYNVPVYLSLDDARFKDETAQDARRTDAAYRARAANAWAAGADGIYFFNLFDPKRAVWHECGDLKTLVGLNKDYFASALGDALSAGGNLKTAGFRSAETLSPNAPRTVSATQPAAATIDINEADDISAAPRVTLQLRFNSMPTKPVSVSLNGARLDQPTTKADSIAFDIKQSDLRKGTNRVEVSSSASLNWIDLNVNFDYGHEPATRPANHEAGE